MATQWYYVQGNERVGPVEEAELKELYDSGTLNEDSYVWKKGFDNWAHLKDVDELSAILAPSSAPAFEIEDNDDVDEIPVMGGSFEGPAAVEEPLFDLSSIGQNEKVFSIKVGYDRGGQETEYGPFSLNQLGRAFTEQRINEKTFIFTPGMSTWVLLGDFDRFDEIAGGLPPQITPEDRRINVRKPFVARLFFHDNSQVYEGVCRDISVGGLQILVSDFPCEIGDNVSMNVHPDNSNYHFTASGRVVRKLEGNAGFSLRFDGLNQEAQEAIQNYINEY